MVLERVNSINDLGVSLFLGRLRTPTLKSGSLCPWCGQSLNMRVLCGLLFIMYTSTGFSECRGSSLDLHCVVWDGLNCTICLLMRTYVLCSTLQETLYKRRPWAFIMLVFDILSERLSSSSLLSAVHIVAPWCRTWWWWFSSCSFRLHELRFHEPFNGAVRRFIIGHWSVWFSFDQRTVCEVPYVPYSQHQRPKTGLKKSFFFENPNAFYRFFFCFA
jgi:hypothetical protein